jgi:hypothetical protein
VVREDSVAYVGDPFKHDIFITYSHGDADGTGVSKISRWSRAFARELESELKSELKYQGISVFIDHHPHPQHGIDPMSPPSDQLRHDVGGAALLTVLMSPHYLNSTWCSLEREWWFQQQTQLTIPIDGRIAIARIWRMDDPWPEDFTDRRGEPLIGFWFYDRQNPPGKPQPFEWPEPGPDSKGPFREELLRLVASLWEKLYDVREQIDERRREAEERARLAASGGQVVYLHGRKAYEPAWEQAYDALSHSGFVVMPSQPEDTARRDASDSHQVACKRIDTLTGCDALLLVGTDDGDAVDADLVVVGRNARESARQRSKRLLPCALLDAAGSVIGTPRRKDAARRLGVEWIDATREPWTPAVRQWLLHASGVEVV